MKHYPFLSLVVPVLLIGGAACGQQNKTEAFVASTPCSQGTRPLPGMAANEPCGLMKWKLVLYPARFTLHCNYGLPKQGTKGLIAGGKTLDLSGTWFITKGIATDPDAVVYRLTDNKTKKIVSFLKLSDNLLHLLDSGDHLMIGTAAWSYSLNRLDQ